MSRGESGKIYAGTRGLGRVYEISDNGKERTSRVVVDKLNQPAVTLHKGNLYVMSVDKALRFDGIEANPNAQTIQWKTANQVTDMAQVLAIEVCLRVASINTVHHTKPNVNLKGCQDEALPSDGRVRRTFKRVMTLRNREGVMP